MSDEGKALSRRSFHSKRKNIPLTLKAKRQRINTRRVQVGVARPLERGRPTEEGSRISYRIRDRKNEGEEALFRRTRE